MRLWMEPKDNHAATFTEYVILAGLAVAALLMVNNYLRQGISGGTKAMVDQYFGAGNAEQRLSPYMVDGGKQLVDQTGVYVISGDTSKVISAPNINNSLFSDGSRNISWNETEQKQSPADPNARLNNWNLPSTLDGQIKAYPFDLAPLPDYKLQDPEKVPVFMQEFVPASDGAIAVPTS